MDKRKLNIAGCVAMCAIKPVYFSSVRRPFRIVIYAAMLAGVSMTHAVYANDFNVYSPYVIQGNSEIEYSGYSTGDAAPSLDGARAYDFSVAYGVSSWWKAEVYFAQYRRVPGGKTKLTGSEFENIFQLAPMGEYWIDSGFLVSYAHIKASSQPDTLEFGPLFAKRVGRINQRLNLIWEKEVGAGASGKYEFRSAYSINYRHAAAFQPGMEAYYRPNDSASQLGPVISGEFYSNAGRELEYRIGLIFGVNSTAPDRTMVTELEYEF
jgi:hypothetical protein